MCGISGFIKFSKDLSYPQISNFSIKMSKTLEKRGPDAFGHWVDENEGVSLSHRRLSVIDLSKKANQPMISQNKRFILSYNGEIYNFKFLRTKFKKILPELITLSDTEVLLELISSIGIEETLKNINGIFCFGIWDSKKKKMFVCRDRVGVKPVYIYWDTKNFAFASEIKALKTLPWLDFQISRRSLASYVRFNYVPSPHSIYENIMKLEPGSIFEIDEKKNFSLTKYWSLEKKENFNSSKPDDTFNILNKAVKSQMVSDVPLGVFLSGGIDSSLITALAQENSSKKINSFTIGFQENNFDEAPYARKISEILQTNHNEVYFNYNDLKNLIIDLPAFYDEPFADSSQLPTMLLCKVTKEKVTVALSGDGGDELFGGYYRYFLAEKYERYITNQPKILRFFLKKIINSVPINAWNKIGLFLPKRFGGSQIGDKLVKLSDLLMDNQVSLFQQRIVSNIYDLTDCLVKPIEQKAKYFDNMYETMFNDSVTRMQALDFMSYLPDDILTKVDRASMNNSLEVRVPFLDNDVILHAWGLEKKYKISRGNGKLALKKVLKRFLPNNLINRPKMGFGIPLNNLIKKYFNDKLEYFLNSKEVEKQNLFNLDYYRILWEQHRNGKRNWQFILWNFIVFQIWYDKWERKK